MKCKTYAHISCSINGNIHNGLFQKCEFEINWLRELHEKKDNPFERGSESLWWKGVVSLYGGGPLDVSYMLCLRL